jgi:hypothetical protein
VTEETTAGLARCATVLQTAIDEFRVSWALQSDVPPERALDTTGRPILAEMYAALGNVLAALSRVE